jgi:hypothetical protein
MFYLFFRSSLRLRAIVNLALVFHDIDTLRIYFIEQSSFFYFLHAYIQIVDLGLQCHIQGAVSIGYHIWRHKDTLFFKETNYHGISF